MPSRHCGCLATAIFRCSEAGQYFRCGFRAVPHFGDMVHVRNSSSTPAWRDAWHQDGPAISRATGAMVAGPHVEPIDGHALK